jgi:hypothetical protein
MSAQLQVIRNAIKEKHTRERSELEAKHAAELDELEAEAAAAAQAAADAATAVEAAAAAVAEATAKKNAAATLNSALAKKGGGSPPPQAKPKKAFKLIGQICLDDGSARISDLKDFATVNYRYNSPLPSCDDEKKAVEDLTGRICHDGNPLSSVAARRMVHWKNSMERARRTGELIFLAACGKEGEKHGGEFRRVVGPYTYEPTPLPGGYICYHRYATKHERPATREEYEKAMQQRNGNNQCLQWEIDI